MTLSVPRLLPTKTYPFSDIRHTLSTMGIQAGVVANEFAVTQDTGSNMNSKVAIGNSGAWVLGLDTSRQGAYHVYNDAAVTLTHTAANGTNPRIDQVVLRVYDSNVIGGGLDQASLEVIAGTATSGATLANRTGATDLTAISAPKTLIRLADVLIPAASTAVTNANIRDRRPWARGAYSNVTAAGPSAVTTSQTEFATALRQRVECSGVPVRVTLQANVTPGSAGQSLLIGPTSDGVFVKTNAFQVVAQGTTLESFTFVGDFVPAAGSHLFTALANTGTGTSSLTNIFLAVEELVRPLANNGTA